MLVRTAHERIQSGEVGAHHLFFWPEDEVLDIVGELKGVNLGDDEDANDDGVEEDDIDDDSGGQPPQDSNWSKRPTPDSGQRRSNRLAQQRRDIKDSEGQTAVLMAGIISPTL